MRVVVEDDEAMPRDQIRDDISALLPACYTFRSTTQMFFDALRNRPEDIMTGDHVLLHGRFPEAHLHAMHVAFGGDRFFPAIHRVVVSETKKRADVSYAGSRRGILVDVSQNARAADGVPAFLDEMTRVRDVAHDRKIVAVMHVDLLDNVSQAALKKIVERAHGTSWIVFTCSSPASLERALLSRFVCINVSPVTHQLIGGLGASELRRKEGPGFKDSVKRLLTRIGKMERLNEIDGIKVPRMMTDNGFAPFFEALLECLAELPVYCTVEENSNMSKKKKVMHLRSPCSLEVVTRRLCVVEVAARDVTRASSGDRDGNADNVLLGCALAYVRLALTWV